MTEPSQRVIDRTMVGYNKTPYFQGRAIPIASIFGFILTFIQSFAECRNQEKTEKAKQRVDDRMVRKLRKGGRYAKNYAMGCVRDAHPEVPEDQQQVLAENQVEEWKVAPEDEVRELVEMAHNVVAD